MGRGNAKRARFKATWFHPACRSQVYQFSPGPPLRLGPLRIPRPSCSAASRNMMGRPGGNVREEL